MVAAEETMVEVAADGVADAIMDAVTKDMEEVATDVAPHQKKPRRLRKIKQNQKKLLTRIR